MTTGESGSTTTPVWIVQTHRLPEHEDIALKHNVVVMPHDEAPDLSEVTSLADALTLVQHLYPTDHVLAMGDFARQMHSFANRINVDDIIVMPLHTRPGHFALGRCSGNYDYREFDAKRKHTRAVRWYRIDVQRTEIKADLRRSVDGTRGVYRLRRRDASQRFVALLNHEPDPGPPDDVADDTPDDSQDETVDAVSPEQPLQERAQDAIRDFVRERFTGHEFARLVDAILQAQGYVTRLSPPGPDGGVDVLAGRGPLGFDHPRLCVQVKATAAAADVKVVRELQGTMQSFRARHGLFVCWGGFTRDARNWARDNHFKVRLWDADDVMEALQDVYDKLAEEIRAEIPLKQVWTLVQEDDL